MMANKFLASLSGLNIVFSSSAKNELITIFGHLQVFGTVDGD